MLGVNMKQKPIIMIQNRKPPSEIKITEKDGDAYVNLTEHITSTFIKERDEKIIEYICQNIQKFIEDNNIDVCFAINQDEMLDCLNEHSKLKHEIEVLKFKEKNYLKQIKHLKQEQASNHEHNLLVENLKSRIKQLEDVIRSM
jgi:hypothetical protein